MKRNKSIVLKIVAFFYLIHSLQLLFFGLRGGEHQINGSLILYPFYFYGSILSFISFIFIFWNIKFFRRVILFRALHGILMLLLISDAGKTYILYDVLKSSYYGDKLLIQVADLLFIWPIILFVVTISLLIMS